MAVYYFYVRAALPVLELYFLLLSEIPAEIRADVVRGQIRHVAFAMLFAAIWVSYLRKSQRVRNTFGVNARWVGETSSPQS